MMDDPLLERLRAAETVCMLVSWIAASSKTDLDKALLQAWMDWRPMSSERPVITDEWRLRIAELAMRRDKRRRLTLAQIRERGGEG